VFKRCSCINPSTGKQYGRRCPKLERSDHGAWWFTHDVPPGADGRRRRPTRGPFASEHEADIALTESLAAWNAGIRVETPASLTVGQYLDDWLAGKVNLEPKTRQGYESHLRLYLKPGLGHLRLTDLRDHHVEQLYAAMRQVGHDRHAKPSPILARILEVRHDDPARRRPPSAANLRRVHATLMSALNSAVRRRKIPYNPAEHVELEIPRRPKPRAWTAARVAAWERTGRRPSKVMVWTPDQAGAFLDFATADRLYPLWHLVAHRALRRGEAVALGWAETDLATATIYILDNLPDPDLLADDEYTDPKSEAGDRTISLDTQTVTVLLTWHAQQAAERRAAAERWVDSGRVFTHPDGRSLRPDGVSQRFDRLLERFNKIRHEHTEKGWTVEQLAARHRMPPEAIEVALAFGPLPPIRFHDLRHTGASLTYRVSRDLKVVSELLGHSSIHFTGDTYTTLFEEVDREAAEAVARLVPRKLPPAADGTARSHPTGTPPVASMPTEATHHATPPWNTPLAEPSTDDFGL